MLDARQRSVTTLDNGLNVVTVLAPHLHAATISVFARVGSRHEDIETNGLSHFLEHMLFRGCDGFPDSTTLNVAMEDLGGYLDGYTTRDHTGYSTTVHPDHVADATEILGRMFMAPHFKEMSVERQIILEEILDTLDHRGRQVDIDVIAHRQAFPGHPLGQPIDGSQANVKRFSDEDLHRHRQYFYGAKNLVVCFAGRVDPAKCRRAAKRAFGGLFPGKRAREGGRPPLPNSAPSFEFVHADDAQTRVRVSFRTISDTHPDYPALLILRRVLDGGLSARLQTELVDKRGLVYEVGADIEPYSDCGLFDFELAVAHRKVVESIEALFEVIRRIRDEGPTEEEVERFRRRAVYGLQFGLDSLSDLSHWFGALQLFHDPVMPKERLAQFATVTPRDVRRAAQRYFRGSRMSVAAVGGADKKTVREMKRALVRLAGSL